MNTLIGISYSPWSEKAKWGLKLVGLPFQYREYLPMLGELSLRARLRRWRGKVTVPILLTDEGPVSDSFAIVQWASARGPRSLITAEHEPAIRRWNELSERALATGRERTTLRVAADPTALTESVPGVLGRLGPVSRAIGRVGTRFLARKYSFAGRDDAARVAEIRGILDELRAALAGGNHLVGDELTYADITMAVGLQFVSPPDRIRLGPKSRGHWTIPELAREYTDVLAWRDRLYATIR